MTMALWALDPTHAGHLPAIDLHPAPRRPRFVPAFRAVFRVHPANAAAAITVTALTAGVAVTFQPTPGDLTGLTLAAAAVTGTAVHVARTTVRQVRESITRLASHQPPTAVETRPAVTVAPDPTPELAEVA